MPDDLSAAAPDAPGIAVIGMAGRFPGARDVAAFWANLRAGVESIARFGAAELEASGLDPAALADPRWVAAGGALEGIDRFDAGLFQVTPREAELLDPQHRLFLEEAWAALEDAGCDPARFAGAIGVFAGASLNTYLLGNILPSLGYDLEAAPQAWLASDKDFLTTRVSYKLDLKGPSLDVQTACSTSLVAVVLACQSLLSYQCDLALAGGVSVRVPQRTGYRYQENGILSPDGRCRPFDAAAAGTVPGSGVGVVVLKRLDEALADGDAVRAVVRGAALNNDGAGKAGYTAPGVAGQAEVVATAMAVAGVTPDDIGFVEAHGTATPIGDPIEVRALERAFAGARRRRSCVLGSVKSNVGHLDAAAGIAGFVKAVLALEHREIPPTLHFERPNPEIDLESGPFRVEAGLVPFAAPPTSGRPRVAGVSSFGIGGTNAHVILEEAPARPARQATPGPELLILSARTPAALDRAAAALADHLERHDPQGHLPLADVGTTLRLGRRQLGARRAVVAHDLAAAVAALREPAPAVEPATPAAAERSIAFLFPGQGAQHAAMAAGLYREEPVFRREVDAWCDRFAPYVRLGGLDLRAALVPEPGTEAEAAERLAETALAQPALFTVEVALARLWMSWGVKPAAMLGHSLGEYVAAHLAGVLPAEDAARLVAARGRLLQELPAGAMLAVPLPAAELALELGGEGLALAAVNAPDRSVVAGPAEAVARLAARLAERGVEARPLAARRAFHSPMVEPALAGFLEEVRRARLSPPESPYLSNLTGGWVTPEQATDPAAWAEHLRRPVQFARGVAELLADPGRTLLEVGPGQTLAALARRQAGAGRTVVASLPHPDAAEPPRAHLLGTLGRLWLAGHEVDWEGFEASRVTSGRRGRRVPLPTYPFERERHWIEAPPRTQQAAATARPAPAPSAPAWLDLLRLAARERELWPRDGGPPPEVTDPEVTGLIAGALRRAGMDLAPGEACSVAELRTRLSVAPQRERLFRKLLALLAEDGVLALEGEDGGEVVRALFPPLPVDAPSPSARGRGPERGGMGSIPLRDLLEHCAAHLPEVLAGRLDGLTVLYPGGSPELLARATRTAGDHDPSGRLLAELLAGRAAEAARAGDRLRLLEVGAGHGLLTRRLLPALAGRPVEYHVTDLGRSFVLRAERELGGLSGDGVVLRFGVLDASADPAPQGWAPGSFDAVVAEDVIHATPRIAETLGHLGSLLVPGGLLAIVETVRPPRWADLVWGLTDGWWRFADTELRPDSPLLDAEAWEEALTRAGLVAAAWPRGAARERWQTALVLGARPADMAVGAAEPAVIRPAEEPESPAAIAAGPAPAALHERPTLMTPYVAPRDEVEREVAAIWRRALGIERIGVDDGFLELGGDSLVGLEVTRAIQEGFGLSGLSLYEHPTVAAIARFITAGTADTPATPAPEVTTAADRHAEERGERRRERRARARRIST